MSTDGKQTHLEVGFVQTGFVGRDDEGVRDLSAKAEHPSGGLRRS